MQLQVVVHQTRNILLDLDPVSIQPYGPNLSLRDLTREEVGRRQLWLFQGLLSRKMDRVGVMVNVMQLWVAICDLCQVWQ